MTATVVQPVGPIPPIPPAAPPTPPVDPAAIAAAMDPAAVAQYVQPAQPPAVEILHRFFASVDGITVAIVVLLLAFLLARLIQAWMLHRSINKSIETKSDHAGALIDKVNKPMELAARGPRELPGDDRNGLVLIAIGLAMGGFGLVQGDEQTIRLAVGAAFFPLFVGAALLVRRALLNRAIAREQAAAAG